VSGYNLSDLLPEKGFNLARALTGTESTCVLVLEAKVRLLPDPPHHALLVVGYADAAAAADHVPALLQTEGLIGLECFDAGVLDNLAKGPPNRRRIALQMVRTSRESRRATTIRPIPETQTRRTSSRHSRLTRIPTPAIRLPHRYRQTLVARRTSCRRTRGTRPARPVKALPLSPRRAAIARRYGACPPHPAQGRMARSIGSGTQLTGTAQDEAERVAAVRRYGILDTPRDEALTGWRCWRRTCLTRHQHPWRSRTRTGSGSRPCYTLRAAACHCPDNPSGCQPRRPRRARFIRRKTLG
jgi:hypothetical protein